MASPRPKLRSSFRHFRAHLEAMGLDKSESLEYARRLQTAYDTWDSERQRNAKAARFHFTATFYADIYDELREDYETDMHSTEWDNAYESP